MTEDHTQPDIYDLLAEAQADGTRKHKQMPPVCPRCRHPHLKADVIPSGSRFALHPQTWRAANDGAPSRGTREQAAQDMCDHHADPAPITTRTTTTPTTTKENR